MLTIRTIASVVVFLSGVLLLFPVPAHPAVDGAAYVGSQSCQKCHQTIYREWRQTLHSQMIKDVKQNPNAIIGDFESPSDIRTFTKDQVVYTIGNQWKQRYITRKGDELYILPAQYNHIIQTTGIRGHG